MAVAVTVSDDEIVVDFTGSSRQSDGAINASFSQTLSGVVYAIRCFIDPSIPMNEGCFRSIRTVHAPGIAPQPEPAGRLWRQGGGGLGRRRGDPRGTLQGRPRPRRGGERPHPRVHLERPSLERRALVAPRLRVRGGRCPDGCRRPGRHRRLLPRRALGHPPARTSRGAAPLRRRALRAWFPTAAAPAGGVAGGASSWRCG